MLAEEWFSAIESQIDYSLSSLTALKAFFESNTAVTRRQFRIFSHSLLKQYPEIQALEWIPIVPEEPRTQFESIARDDGLSELFFQDLGQVVSHFQLGNGLSIIPCIT